MFQAEVVGKIKIIYFTFKNFFPKIIRLWDNVEEYITARHVTDDSTMQHMRFAGRLKQE